MNGGSSVFLIFLLIVAAFAGLGYLVTEMNHLNEDVQTLQTRNNELESENQRFKDQNETILEENEQLRTALENAQVEVRDLITQTIGLQGELSTVQAALEQAEGQAQDLQSDLEEAHASYNALSAENEDLALELDQARTAIDELTALLENARLENRILQDENAFLQTSIAAQEPQPDRMLEMSFLPIVDQVFSIAPAWVLLFLVLLVLGTAAFSLLSHNLCSRQTPTSSTAILRHPAADNSERVTLRMTRQQLSRYIRWLRQES